RTFGKALSLDGEEGRLCYGDLLAVHVHGCEERSPVVAAPKGDLAFGLWRRRDRRRPWRLIARRLPGRLGAHGRGGLRLTTRRPQSTGWSRPLDDDGRRLTSRAQPHRPVVGLGPPHDLVRWDQLGFDLADAFSALEPHVDSPDLRSYGATSQEQ